MGWETIRRRQAAGDRALDELFRSPLRLTIALQAYRDRDPSELLDLSLEQAKGRLWEAPALEHPRHIPGCDRGAGSPAGSAFLAAGMRRTGRQRFMLHELLPHRPRPGHHRTTLWCDFRAGLLAGPRAGRRAGLRGGRRASQRANFGLIYGLGSGLGLGLKFWTGELPRGGLNDMLAAGIDEPPARFADKRPDALSVDSTRAGWIKALVVFEYKGAPLIVGGDGGLRSWRVDGLPDGTVRALSTPGAHEVHVRTLSLGSLDVVLLLPSVIGSVGAADAGSSTESWMPSSA